MDNNRYLKKLRRLLVDLDRKSRNTIISELKSAGEENANESLESRFGKVEDLAQNYLEGVPKRSSIGRFIMQFLKWILISLGVIVVLLIGIAIYFTNDHDDFDYSNLNADELQQVKWQKVDLPIEKIDFSQSHIILYASDEKSLSYSCKRGRQKNISIHEDEGKIDFFQNKCFIKIPKSVETIKAHQATMVLVELNENKVIDLFQSKLRIVPHKMMQLTTEIEQCELDEALSSNKDAQIEAHNLTITGSQCSISVYEY